LQVSRPIASAPVPKEIDFKILQIKGKKNPAFVSSLDDTQKFDMENILPEIQKAPRNISGEYQISNIKRTITNIIQSHQVTIIQTYLFNQKLPLSGSYQPSKISSALYPLLHQLPV
jgi:hypothetical protein